MVFVENDSFRNLRRLPTDAFRSIPRLPREALPVAASDLVAWYPFREGTGVDVTAGDSRFGDTTDYSASVDGATYKPNGGATDILTGANSGAFEFDGTDDELANVKGLSGTEFTILAQIDISTSNSDFGRIYSSNDANGNDGIGLEARSDNNTLRAKIRKNGTTVSAVTSFQGLTSGFGQVGLRYDGSQIEVIKNGTVKSATAVSFSVPENPAKIGMRPNGVSVERFGGVVDSARLYDAFISDNLVAEHDQNTSP